MATYINRLKPVHLEMIKRFWACETYKEIADAIGYTPQQVMNVIHSDEAQDVLRGLQDATIDTMNEVASELQLAAPEVVKDKIRMALHSSDEKVRTTNGTEILHMAGHSPVKRVMHERGASLDKKYADKTEDEIRQQLAIELGIVPGIAGNGPDGRPLN